MLTDNTNTIDEKSTILTRTNNWANRIHTYIGGKVATYRYKTGALYTYKSGYVTAVLVLRGTLWLEAAAPCCVMIAKEAILTITCINKLRTAV